MDYVGRLGAAWQSSKSAWGMNRVFEIDDNRIETNLPWSALRTLFSFALVPLQEDEWVVDSMTTAERYADEES